MSNAEWRLNEKIVSANEELDAKMVLRLAELKAESQAWAAEKITQEINILKPWIGKVADDKIFASERKQTAEYTKKVKEIKDLVSVPELIGSIGCTFPDFQTFALKTHANLSQLSSDQHQITENFQLEADLQKQIVVKLEESIGLNSASL